MSLNSWSLLLLSLLAATAFSQDIMDFSGDDSDLSMEVTEARAVQERFDAAVSTRMSNFFCLDRITNYNPMTRQLNISYTQYEQNSSNVWTLFFQMPLLGYLDVARKRALMDIVVNMTTGSSTLSLSNICIGTYETYGLTTYRESVLIHVYSGRMQPFDVQTLNTNFQNNVNSAFGNSGDYRVIGYPGQPGLMTFNLTASSEFEKTVLFRGASSSDGAVPMNLAVYLGSYVGNYTFTTPITNVSVAFGDVPSDRFATNPNPINYGLEAGDIVFAVIGSILLVIVSGLIVFGYFIHPFWFA